MPVTKGKKPETANVLDARFLPIQLLHMAETVWEVDCGNCELISSHAYTRN